MLTENEDGRITCHHCSTRYKIGSMKPGQIFSCTRCGELVRTPGTNAQDTSSIYERAFGESAITLGYLTPTQLEHALQTQISAANAKKRLPDILLQMNVLSYQQLRNVLQQQNAEITDYIPGYEIVRILGKGGMGAVYKGMHIISNKTVAIKVLAPHLTGNDIFLERFHREARVAIKLDHPNIVKGYDEGCVGDTHYFVMEYVHGKSVGRVLKKRTHFGERRAFDIIRQVTLALEYAHARGIVHRDVKPDNIMLTREGKARLADYGLVKFADDLSVAGLTTEGQIMGTPNYISPEQAGGESNIDIRSDIYSLGATLFHMIVGRPPFKDKKLTAILNHHRFSPLPNPRELNPDLSESASNLVQKMMAKERVNRFQTPKELEEAISSYFRGSSIYMTEEDLMPEAEGEIDPENLQADPSSGSLTAQPEILHEQESDEEPIKFYQRPAFAIGLGIGIASIMLAVFAWIMSARKTNTQPQPPEEKMTSSTEKSNGLIRTEKPPALSPEDEVSTEESISADLYRQALLTDKAEQRKIFENLVNQYPSTTSGVLAQQELDRIRAEERRQKQVEQLAKKQRYERAAENALADAMTKVSSGSDAFSKALTMVTQKYKETPAAQKAQKELDQLNASLAAEQKRIEEEKRLEQQRIRAQKRLEIEERIQPIRNRFISYYIPALQKHDYDDAEKYARFLSEDDRYPELKPLGKSCLSDIEDLRKIDAGIAHTLNNAAESGETVTLNFNSGRTVEATIKEINGNTIRMLADGRIPLVRQMSDLTEETFFGLYTKGRSEEDPSPELAKALWLLAERNPYTGAAFRKIGKNDPRYGHHMGFVHWLDLNEKPKPAAPQTDK